MDLQKKSESLASKMEKLTQKFENNIGVAEDMESNGSDVLENTESRLEQIQNSSIIPAAEIVNLENLVKDFQFVRETLKENTENGRRVLSAVTLDLLESEDEKRSSLIMSFAELNKAVADNMKLYIKAYTEISNTLLNIEKMQRNAEKAVETDKPKTKNVNSVSTVDVINQLKEIGE